MSEFQPGEIVEISTDAGLRYAVVTHRHPSYPSVVRMMAGVHETRPGDLSEVAGGEAAFTAMLSLGSVLTTLGLDHEVAGTVDVDTLDEFPTFRMPIRDKQGEIVYWWFWDGRGLTYEVDPDTDTDALPLREVMSAEQFRTRLGETG